MKKEMMLNKVVKTIVAIALITVFFGCKKNDPNPNPPFDLDVILYSTGKAFNGSGFIKFRQDPDTARIIDLNTVVSNLEPDHAYLLQRAVNPITDSTHCSSTAWLTLGLGLTPQAIHTDGHGFGHADLNRNITAIARGTQFYIHFQVVDSATLAPALSSGCYQYTVR